MESNLKKSISETDKSTLQKFFDSVDVDKSGSIQKKELLKLVHSVGHRDVT